MKTHTIKAHFAEDIRAKVHELVEKSGRPTANGGTTGNKHTAAQTLGIHTAHLNSFLNGLSKPPSKVLEFFGLRAQDVYVKKEAGRE